MVGSMSARTDVQPLAAIEFTEIDGPEGDDIAGTNDNQGLDSVVT